MNIETGSRFGSYEVQEFLGRGAMGVVYRGYHEGLDRTVAIKVLQGLAPEPDAVARFQREARAIAQMRHPNILNVFDFGDVEGTPYMVVEYVPGGSLSDVIASGRIDNLSTLSFLHGVASGLDYAHGRGILHRDIKPENVLMGGDSNPIIADFGLAKLAQSGLKTRTSVISGSPAYMAPEQVTRGDVGPATDQYALACTAYEMLTGRLPFEAEDLMQLLFAHVNQDPEPITEAELGPDVDGVLRRALAKDPSERWETCCAMVTALQRALGVQPETNGATSIVPPPVPIDRSTRVFQGVPPPIPGSTPLPAVNRASAPAAPASPSHKITYSDVKRAMEDAPPPAAGSAVSTLLQMGVPRLATEERFSLNSHFANILHTARDVAAERWGDLVEAAELTNYMSEDPPVNNERTTPIENLSRLNEAFEIVYGPHAPEYVRKWGRQATDRAFKLRKSSGTEQRAFKLIPGEQRKLTTLLKSFTKSMDEVRGAHTHTWKQIDQNQFWLVHFSNLYALGRRKQEKSCYVWTSSFEAMLRWAGLANKWIVDEIECGCVTGTFDCVFAVKSTRLG